VEMIFYLMKSAAKLAMSVLVQSTTATRDCAFFLSSSRSIAACLCPSNKPKLKSEFSICGKLHKVLLSSLASQPIRPALTLVPWGRRGPPR
jgi:hypothetical protein